MNKKITELEKIIETSRRKKDAFGQWEKEQKKIRVKHTLDEPGIDIRAFHFFFDVLIAKLIAYIIFTYFYKVEIESISYFIANIGDKTTLSVYLLYIVFFELLFQKTLSKFITKTIVVDEYGNKPSAISIILRTFARIVPFDGFVFVFFDRTIHDFAGGTYVLHKESLEVVKKLQEDELNMEG